MKNSNKKSIVLDTLFVAIIGLIVLIMINKIFTPIEGTLATTGVLAGVYAVYHGVKYFLSKR